MKRKVSLDTAQEAADIFRGMYDEEESNTRLRGRIRQLEMVLMENHIAYPTTRYGMVNSQWDKRSNPPHGERQWVI